jgi:hypothetical protein
MARCKLRAHGRPAAARAGATHPARHRRVHQARRSARSAAGAGAAGPHGPPARVSWLSLAQAGPGQLAGPGTLRAGPEAHLLFAAPRGVCKQRANAAAPVLNAHTGGP